MKRSPIHVVVGTAVLIVTSEAFSQGLSPADARRAAQARLERIPHADQGNGYYRNPILVGPGADNSIVRVGKDSYMIASGGHLIWNSRDLVNWRPLTKAFGGGTWASDITYHDGRYYICTTLYNPRLVKPENRNLTGAQVSLLGAESKDTGDPSFDNIVIWADNPAGPWSEPIHLGVYGLFDPGHIADQKGDRYLYFNKGIVVQLKPDGLGTIGDIKKVYDGWDYPDQWVLECHCLEAPKLTYHNGYYYMASAEGGTAGPSTAHMAVMARSQSLQGPWENSLYNPVIRTENRRERWWRQGHGTLIDDASGNCGLFTRDMKTASHISVNKVCCFLSSGQKMAGRESFPVWVRKICCRCRPVRTLDRGCRYPMTFRAPRWVFSGHTARRAILTRSFA